jgi:hypothetical protein
MVDDSSPLFRDRAAKSFDLVEVAYPRAQLRPTDFPE